MEQNNQNQISIQDGNVRKLLDKGYLFLILAAVPVLTFFIFPAIYVLFIFILANLSETAQYVTATIVAIIELFFLIKAISIGKKLLVNKKKVHGLIMIIASVGIIIFFAIAINEVFLN